MYLKACIHIDKRDCSFVHSSLQVPSQWQMDFCVAFLVSLRSKHTDMYSMGFTEGAPTPSVNCKVYEDNSGALQMAREYMYQPRKKFLNVELHCFRDYVDRGKTTIHKIRTEDQPADYLTKPLHEKTHANHRKEVPGW